ncbi:MAG: carboxypeptidase-like regulatory domain-containing protein, partial [Nodosilinea sp.]
RNRDAPIFQVVDSECIGLLHMDLVTLGGTAIALHGSKDTNLKDIEIGHNRFIACQQAICVQHGSGVHIHHSLIRMLDKANAGVAIYLHADDSRIERNDLGVIPFPSLPPIDTPDGEEVPDPTDPCAPLELIYTNIPFFTAYISQIWAVSLLFLPTNPYRALGGIQLAGGAERVAVLDNKINGGAGNGIALGTSLVDFLEGLDPADPDSAGQTINLESSILWGDVRLDGSPLANISLQFEPDSGSQLSALTDASSEFLASAVPGTYTVSILSPGYRIASITPQDRQQFGTFHQIELERSALDLGDLFAFIYEVSIRHNTISNMGLSGIGLPAVEVPDDLASGQRDRLLRAYAQVLRVFGNPILGLNITENHILHCFQNPLTQALRDLVGQRGLGGISLGLCADVAIHRNRIEKNGVVHTKPSCGVWISYGEEVGITHNALADNAPLSVSASVAMQPGLRGGIALIASSLSILNFLPGENRDQDGLVTRRPAARIQNNSVDQPAGRALTLLAFGPVTLLDNQFNSELAGLNSLERAVGTLLVLNLGGLNQAGSFISRGTTDASGNLSSLNNRQPGFQRDSAFRLPNGLTLFNSNQTRQGLNHQSLISQLIWTADDLGFDGNQAEALNPGLPIGDNISALINTTLLAATLRASDSRLKEPLSSPQTAFQYSLLTVSTLMNTTTTNQGSHCIVANNLTPGRSAIAKGNQVLDTSLCPNFDETQ